MEQTGQREMIIKKLFGLMSSKSKQETKEETRQRQNNYIKAQHRTWQLAWHDLFNQDPGQASADNAAKDSQIPDDPNCDYRLIFGFCEITKGTRAACLSLLPHGDELTKRFEQFYNTQNTPIPPAKAMDLAGKLTETINNCHINFEADWNNIIIAEMNDKTALDALEIEHDLHELFEGSLLEPHPEEKLEMLAADLFLTEPFYAAAGNYYQAGRWITGLYHEPARDKCLAIVYALWLGGWDLSLGRKGIALIPLR